MAYIILESIIVSYIQFGGRYVQQLDSIVQVKFLEISATRAKIYVFEIAVLLDPQSNRAMVYSSHRLRRI